VSEERKAWREMLSSLAAWVATGCQAFAAGPSPAVPRTRACTGRVTLRLRMSREAFAWWRGSKRRPAAGCPRA